jgi:hypothetical protein
MNIVCQCFLHLQSVNNKQKCSGGLLIAIIMGVLVDITITKANKHFGLYCDNEAQSTQCSYETFSQNNLLNTLAKFVRFTAEHPVCSSRSDLILDLETFGGFIQSYYFTILSYVKAHHRM